MSADHGGCLERLFDLANWPTSSLSDLPGAMAVTEDEPTVTAPEFPAQRVRCPHGVQFYAYPNTELIAALRALNDGGAS